MFLFIELQVQYWLVAGGVVGYYRDHSNYETLSSTEILTPGAAQWQFAGELPSARGFFGGVTIGGSFIVAGGCKCLT